MAFDFEKRICDAAREILIAGGFDADEVLVSSVWSATPKGNLKTPRVELQFQHSGSVDQLRNQTTTSNPRSFYNIRGGVLSVNYVTDRDLNNTSHAVYLAAGRKAIETATDAQWFNNGDGLELNLIVPGSTNYQMDSDRKQDATQDTFEIAFIIPIESFNPQ